MLLVQTSNLSCGLIVFVLLCWSGLISFTIYDSRFTIYSALSASIGSNFAARQAGHRPLMTPTIDDTLTPRTADPMLKSNGKPINNAINQATPNPVNTP